MAAPNIFNPSNCTLARTSLAATTAATAIVTNSAASNTAVRLTSLYVANVGNATASVTADIHNGTTVQSNIAFGISVPANATLVVVTSESKVHLAEGESIRLTASANGTLQGTASYEVLS